MDVPITKGPLARWQRKNLELSTSSINNTLNASLQLNCPVDTALPCNVSVSINGSNGNRTPSTTPNRRLNCSAKATPNHSKLNISGNKLARTPKTPGGGPDRFIPNRSAMNLDVSHYLVRIRVNHRTIFTVHINQFSFHLLSTGRSIKQQPKRMIMKTVQRRKKVEMP